MPLAPRSIALSTGVTVSCVQQGDPAGPAVVLVHGVTDSWRSWELVLAELPPSVRAIALTQRGHGDAGRAEQGYRPADFAADLVALMDALGVGSAVLAGHSAAGLTIARVAAAHPRRVRGLVFVASPRELDTHPSFAVLMDTIRRLEDPIEPAFVRDWVVGTSAPTLPAAFLDVVVDECLKVPARVWHAAFEGLAGERIDEVGVPSLLLWGDADPIVSRAMQDDLAEALGAGARLEVYPGAGHSPHWEEPRRSAGDIAAFALRTFSGPRRCGTA